MICLFLFSCFTKISECITVHPGEDSEMVDFRDHFPSFLWLLRDATLKPVSEADDELSPTDYLKTQVLCRSKKGLPTKADIVAMAILGYFPTVECQTLPLPSADEDIVQNITEHQEQLSDDFNTRIEEVFRFILENVSVKRGFNTSIPVDGSTLVLLAQGYIVEINKPGSILALECSWHTMVSLKLKELIERLVAEYESEMEAALKQKAPLEMYPKDEDQYDPLKKLENDSDVVCCRPEALMQIHDSIITLKRKIFQDEVKRLMPQDIEGNEEQRKALTVEFERRIVEYEDVKHDTDGGEVIIRTVTGGKLLSFVQRNKQKSLEFCNQLFEELFKPIQDLIDTLSPNSGITFDDLSSEIEAMLAEYRRKAIGPAVEEVYQVKKESMLKHSTEMFHKIQSFNQQAIDALQKADEARLQVNELNEAVNQQTNELKRTITELSVQKTYNMLKMEELQQRADQRFRNELRKQKELSDARMKDAVEQSECKMAEMKESYAFQIARLQQNQKIAEDNYKSKIAALEQGRFTSCNVLQRGGGSSVVYHRMWLIHGTEWKPDKKTDWVFHVLDPVYLVICVVIVFSTTGPHSHG